MRINLVDTHTGINALVKFPERCQAYFGNFPFFLWVSIATEEKSQSLAKFNSFVNFHRLLQINYFFYFRVKKSKLSIFFLHLPYFWFYFYLIFFSYHFFTVKYKEKNSSSSIFTSFSFIFDKIYISPVFFINS